MKAKQVVEACVGFDWDEDNLLKNWAKHDVSPTECEEVFFNRPLVVADDIRHSQSESRYYALGHTDHGRGLFVVFAVRLNLIRVVTARDMTKREWRRYQAQ